MKGWFKILFCLPTLFSSLALGNLPSRPAPPTLKKRAVGLKPSDAVTLNQYDINNILSWVGTNGELRVSFPRTTPVWSGPRVRAKRPCSPPDSGWSAEWARSYVPLRPSFRQNSFPGLLAATWSRHATRYSKYPDGLDLNGYGNLIFGGDASRAGFEELAGQEGVEAGGVSSGEVLGKLALPNAPFISRDVNDTALASVVWTVRKNCHKMFLKFKQISYIPLPVVCFAFRRKKKL